MRRRRDAQEGLARAHAHVLEAPALDDLEAELARELQEELLARLQVVVAARVRPADDLRVGGSVAFVFRMRGAGRRAMTLRSPPKSSLLATGGCSVGPCSSSQACRFSGATLARPRRGAAIRGSRSAARRRSAIGSCELLNVSARMQHYFAEVFQRLLSRHFLVGCGSRRARR
jgi:hypothetical protein